MGRSSSHGCVSAAEGTDAALGASVEPEEGKNMDVKASAHGFVLLAIDSQKHHTWIHLSLLTYLRKEEAKLHEKKSCHDKSDHTIWITNTNRTEHDDSFF